MTRNRITLADLADLDIGAMTAVSRATACRRRRDLCLLLLLAGLDWRR